MNSLEGGAARNPAAAEGLPAAVRWLLRWGMACLVIVAFAAAVFVAAEVSVPGHPPSVALESASLYRVEVGAATFAGIYLVGMAFVLALHNRGFTQIGISGMRAQEIANSEQQKVIHALQEQADSTKQALAAIKDGIGQLEVEIEELKGRLRSP